MKNNSSRLIFGIFYSLLIASASIGSSLLISGLLFGRNGINTTMVDVNNLLMGVIGTPIIIFLTKRYYQNHLIAGIGEVDFYQKERTKTIPLSIFFGFSIVATLFLVLYFSGATITVQSISPKWFPFVSGILTFIGMAVLEECIFRGILRQAFSGFGHVAANLVPILLFSAVHIDLWLNFDSLRLLDLLIASIFFTILLQKTGSLLAVSLTHATYNITLVMLFGIDSNAGILKTTVTSAILGLSAEQFTTMISCGVMVVAIVTVLIWSRSWKKKNVNKAIL